MGPRATPDVRARTAQHVVARVATGEALGDVAREVAADLDVTEATVRRWVREAEATAVATPEVIPTRVVVEPTLPVAPAPAAAKRGRWSTRPVVAIVAAVVAALVSSTAVRTVMSKDDRDAARKVAEYVAGKGTREFVAADLGFRAAFPLGMPKRDVQAQTIAGTTIDVVSYLTESNTRAFSVSSFVLPPETPFDLNASVNGMAVAVDGRVETATPVTFQEFPAIDFEMSGDGFYSSGMVVHAFNRVYILQAIDEGPPAAYDAFKASFRIDPI